MSNDDNLKRLLAMQQREAEIIAESMALQGDDFSDDDDHGHRSRNALAHVRPPMPEMRFEKQFERSVQTLKEAGAGPLTIFLSAVVQDQIVMPLLNGFVWCLAGHAWRWYRMPKQQRAAVAGESSSFVRGVQHGIATWASNVYHTLVHLPALSSSPTKLE
ncbi:hypothetical protein DM01DRAFT_1381266 [Hesseltinella vesiculosa]|uniref:DUF1770-domain-containing protein n=1 Tax=Hesseltinella vesiculosa TaxID=101127 RepID=A0A1X2GRM3_9FUNG|nr:hypothetical protein DM01DRAFT_1381266 [Hesseltinella vesiculosa]